MVTATERALGTTARALLRPGAGQQARCSRTGASLGTSCLPRRPAAERVDVGQTALPVMPCRSTGQLTPSSEC